MLGAVFFPALALAVGPLVTCGTGSTPCHFSDFEVLLKTGINFALFDLVIPLATLSLAIAGLRYLVAFGNEGEAKKIHTIVFYTIMGVVLACGAWLIVSSVLGVLVTGSFNPFQ